MHRQASAGSGRAGVHPSWHGLIDAAVAPAASTSSYDVRRGERDMGAKACFHNALTGAGTGLPLFALAEQTSMTTGFCDQPQRQRSAMPTDPDTSPLDQIMTLSREIVD